MSGPIVIVSIRLRYGPLLAADENEKKSRGFVG